jgi:hypothetical protein
MIGLRRKQFFSEGFSSSPLHGESRFSLHFLCLSKENEAKEKTPFAEAFLQLALQNQSSQPKGGPRLPAFFTVASPYACSPGGFHLR